MPSRTADRAGVATPDAGTERAADPSVPPPAHRGPSFWRRLRRDQVLVLFAVPGVALVLLFQYVPLLGNVIAFQDYQPFLGIGDSPWVGWDNFAIIVSGDPAFLAALRNTLLLTALQVLLVFPAPIALALLLNSLASETLKRIVQNVLYLPHFLSWVIVVALFQQMLGGSGLLNAFLRSHDMATLEIIGNPDVFHLLLTWQVIWKDTGWATILFLAALSTVSPQLYEAASVDGAGRMRQMWHITLPALRGIVILLFILRLGDSLTVGFEQILLQQDAVGRAVSEVLDTYVYNNGILGGAWGTSAAVGLVKGVVGVVLVLAANKVAHIFGEEGVYRS
ncbi:binding-protein-dependent transport systems inner membrane component [Beutenbergia cavernae DSM 12333]|uniref:Binding-protein-dependent transport systems inner membrane component n=1 Tax=Beutenbergia cavernae (strain ATCC BAA-8 / DSM 12333 / CCUG 43141 / JCM 11478 / NBRC 16432 / NCIMB 13614 / HKI 0122) TaxID=471853 RepID=C5C2L0_BEUC1|nr:ABC transporter permease subunit [Beutenbergia cavernae]ACQ79696.1 binding-protein-dependent transport systems inner membrane component [Beutenbergia cavernae DSM 12333]